MKDIATAVFVAAIIATIFGCGYEIGYVFGYAAAIQWAKGVDFNQ